MFYDKGTFSGGWRYLEAAPLETEFMADWGAYQKDVTGTVRVVGGGKRNTELIVEFLRQSKETGKAAQLCASLNFDGFSDWFLPSRDELDLMYENLKGKGLGSFGSRFYWSSSQDDTIDAFIQSFYDGRVNFAHKYFTYSVRAIRAF